jgi:putative aldouronate transport system substrate-binding protein
MKKVVTVFVILIMATAMVFMGCKKEAATTESGPAKVTVEIFDRGTDGGRTTVDNNAWTQWIQEKVLKDLNIEISFIPVGRWSEGTDIINLMASATAPDLCYTYSGPMISSFRDQGGILNLQPYVERLLPDMKKLLGADPAFSGKDFIYRQQEPDGRVFSVPSYRVALAQRNIFIRKDWLDTLGLALPTTTQQFYNALVAFRDRDPGNVGRNNVIPFMMGSGAWWELASFIHPSIDPTLSDRDRYIYNIAGRYYAYPGYKEGARLMNQWYNEGLIFRDFPLMTGDDAQNIIKSGLAGAIAGNWDVPYRTDNKVLEDLRLLVPNADFVPVDAIQSSDGITHKDMMDKIGLQIFVPTFSRNAEAALRYLNWLCIKENYTFLQIGQEGVNHQIVNGVPSIQTRPPNDPWFQNSTQNIDITMPMNGIEMGSADLNARVLALSYGGYSADVIVNAYSVSTRNARAPVVVNIPTSVDGIYGQTLVDKGDALLSQAVTARPAEFDRIWDAGIRDWMQSGAQEIMDERIAIANQWKW